MIKNYLKDPDAILDYVIDWEDWLDGDTLSASTWTPTTGITKDSSTNTTTTTTVWLSGGTVGRTYLAVNHITTAAGREEDRTISITIKER